MLIWLAHACVYFRNTSSYHLPELKLEVLNVFLRHPPDVSDCDGWTTFGVQVGEVQPIRITLHWVGGGQFGSLKKDYGTTKVGPHDFSTYGYLRFLRKKVAVIFSRVLGGI